MSVKYSNYVNLTSLSEEQPNERTPSLPPRKKSLSPPQAPSKSISSKSTHYTSSSSPSESLTPTHVAPPPKLYFVIPIKLEPQELHPPQISSNDPYAQTMDNWPSGPSNPSPHSHVSRPPLGFPNPPPGFEPNASIARLLGAPSKGSIHQGGAFASSLYFFYFAFVTKSLSNRQNKTCKEGLYNTFCFDKKGEKKCKLIH
nr:hypothetical protein [Tanacetum cinerariifolium]